MRTSIFLGTVVFGLVIAACSAPGTDEVAAQSDSLDKVARERAAEEVAGTNPKIALGSAHTCAIARRGVQCWGRNANGQLTVPPLNHPRKLTSSSNHNCVIDDDVIKCWGSNISGQTNVPAGLTHPTDVAVGTGHTCSLSDEGVKCWGTNGFQQLTVPALVEPTKIAAGGNHTCAITAEGVKCWGNNGSGQTAVPAGLNHPTQLALGSNHTCALTDDGVKCWGSSSSGQIAVPALRNPTQITAGTTHTCAVTLEGVKCWGSNSSMQLNITPLRRPTQVGAAGTHTCAVDDDDEVKCWGNNANQQAAVPADLDLVGHHTCTIVGGGELRCIGDNERGQLGVGSDQDRVIAITTAPRTNLGAAFEPAHVAFGNSFGCALSTVGAVKCWGANNRGQLGLGDRTDRGKTPEEMGDALPALSFGTKEPITKLDVGDDHACAVSRAGELFCWGKGTSGQLGLEATDDVLSPTRPMLKKDVVVRDVALGRRHSCALASDGATYCFGANEAGQLGVGHANAVGDRPGTMGATMQASMLGDFKVKKLTAGDGHVCALSEDGRVKCWGSGSEGQLALGDASNRGTSIDGLGEALPTVDLGHGQYVSDLECGSRHCCARTIQNTMKCWGDNSQGQLGLGDLVARGKDPKSTGDHLPFVMTPPGERVRSIHLDGSQTCARTDSGLRCWGRNRSGELGYGDKQTRGGTLTTVPRLLSPLGI